MRCAGLVRIKQDGVLLERDVEDAENFSGCRQETARPGFAALDIDRKQAVQKIDTILAGNPQLCHHTHDITCLEDFVKAKLVEEIMRREVLTVKEKTTIYDAVALMTMNDVGAVIVTNTLNRPIGIFTERDVLKRVVLGGLEVRHEMVASVYTKKLVSVKPKDDLREAAKKMAEGHFRHLAVTDDDGKILGILSARDLLSEYAR